MTLVLHFITSPTQTEIKVPLFPHCCIPAAGFVPKCPLSCPVLLWVLAHCFMDDAHKILKGSSPLMIDTWDKSTGMPGSAVALVTVSSGTWETGTLLCSQKPPWDSHGSVSGRDCTHLSLIQKSASLAFRRCWESGLWFRIYLRDVFFLPPGSSTLPV